jgi:biopolymer transport protein ExbD
VSTLKFKRGLILDEEFIPLASTADIMFLLMIFFLVSTSFNIEKGINMQLPDTVVQEDIPAENVLISLDNAANIFLDGKEIKLKDLGLQVKGALAGHPERYVIIKSDQGVKYSLVVDVLDELFQMGIHNVALPTKKESIGEKPAGGR